MDNRGVPVWLPGVSHHRRVEDLLVEASYRFDGRLPMQTKHQYENGVKDHNDQESRGLMLPIPDYAEPGEYMIRFVIRNQASDVYRIKHRFVEII